MLFLIRGLPGTGKSTLANQLIDSRFNDSHSDPYYSLGKLLEADMFFLSKEGTYEYDSSRIVQAHEWCQAETEKALRFHTLVIVANTFSLRRHIQPYYEIAQRRSCEVKEITLTGPWSDAELVARSVHSVPIESITRMRARWEW